MITGTLSARDRRVLVLGVTTVLGLVIAFRAWPAWLTWRAEGRAAAAEMTRQAAKTSAVLDRFAATLDTLEARRAHLLALGPAFLPGDTPTEAASNLATLLADLARQSLVRLDAIDVRVDTSRTQGLPRVAVDVQATADIAGLSALLYRLERGPALLAIRRLTVRPQNVESPPDQIETLTLRLTVEGLALVHAKRGAP